MARLHYTGRSDYLINYKCNTSIVDVCTWYVQQSVVQLDTETNVCRSIVDRQLKVIQLGDLSGENLFVIQKSFVSKEDWAKLLKVLEDKSVLKIIHNASFDYQVLLNEGIVLENVWDTMVMEQVLYAGHDHDLRFFSLAQVLMRRFYVDVSKEMQAEFGDDIITDEKLVYAATDVVHLGRLYEAQRNDLIEEDLIQLGEGEFSENQIVLAFADIEYNGMGFDPVKWRENIALAEPIVKKATKDLANVLLQEPFYSKGIALEVKAKIVDSEGKERKVDVPAIIPADQLTINWNSSVQVLQVLKMVFPDLEKGSALELKKYLKENDPDAPEKPGASSKAFMDEYIRELLPNEFSVLKLIILKQFDAVEEFFVHNYRDKLVEKKYLLPRDSVMINWNSAPVKLQVFKWFDDKIESTDAAVVKDHMDIPFFQAYAEYAFANALITKYGEKFVENNVDSDGRVRTRFNTILSTGRVSSSQPNMQQIPAMRLPEDRQNDYRNCFHTGYKGWSIIGSDYASQELAVIATLSNDPVFLDALRTGKDLHSVCAEVIYKQKWKDAANDDCAFYAIDASTGLPKKAKCKCKKHKSLRNGVKTLNFGLAYGMSEIALAADLKIDKKAAKQLMDDYFNSFPNIKGLLTALGEFGTTNGFIRTPAPLRRKRYYPYWKGPDTSKFLMGKIDRASKNAPIQGFSADITKIAMVKLRRFINDNKVRDYIKLFQQVHDQIDSMAIDAWKEDWAKTVTKIMEEAASFCLKNDLLKTDTEISKVWQK